MLSFWTLRPAFNADDIIWFGSIDPAARIRSLLFLECV